MPELKKSDMFIVAITNNLTDIKHKVLNFLYAPIVGVSSIQVYMALYSSVGLGTFESKAVPHQNLLQTLAIKPQDFILFRENLEAIGLLDVYYNQGVYLYLLKEPLHPYDFFKNDQLAHLLMVKLGKESFEQLVQELSTYKYDINKFEKITKSFDEVYGIVPLNKKNVFADFWVSANNQGVVLKDRHFDFDQLDILLRARDILSEKIIRTEKFYHEVNLISFFYGFCEKDLEDIILRSVDVDKNLNYDELRKNAKIYYETSTKPVTVERKEPPTVKSKNEVINTLNTLSPNEYVYKQFGTHLTSPEIETIRLLYEETGFPNGVINVLLTYVITELKGQIPNFNYLIKVANTWKRAGVVNTEDALNHINQNNQKTNKNQRYPVKKETKVPGWYENYLVDMEEKIKESSSKLDNVSLEELLKNFKEKE